MALPVLTLNVSGIDAARTLAAVERAERVGLAGVWVPTMGAGPDALTTLAAAAVRTRRVTLATGVLPAFPRHPLVLAQQALAVASLAPGRLRLGIGTSHAAPMQGAFGLSMDRPLRRLRAYLGVLRQALHDGAVDAAGPYYTARARLPAAPGVPVYIAALGARAFRLAGAAADGAVSWLCPPVYLVEVALPALRAGAAAAGRPAPPLVAGLPVAVCEDTGAVRAAVRRQLAGYVRAPFYQNMLVGAGLDEAAAGTWSDRMIERVVIAGDEEAVAARLAALGAAGIDEVAVTPVLTGPDPRAAMQRTLALLATLKGG
jgi:F420-dependent oxidoreductase-like protein